jgi:hypothetical protein
MNDATFRQANERISERAEAADMTEKIPFLCECADESCNEIVRLSDAEYERIRRNATDFLNAPGHEVAAGPHGEVVERSDGYVIVRKTGLAGEIVEDLDPRTTA